MKCANCEKPIGDRKAYTTREGNVFHPGCDDPAWELRQELASATARADKAEALISGALADYERKGYEQTAFALRDGLGLWKRKAEEAEAKADRLAEYQAIIDRVCMVLDRLSPDSMGDLPERVEHAIKAWKRRAAKHGCNVDDGDPDCG